MKRLLALFAILLLVSVLNLVTPAIHAQKTSETTTQGPSLWFSSEDGCSNQGKGHYTVIYTFNYQFPQDKDFWEPLRILGDVCHLERGSHSVVVETCHWGPRKAGSWQGCNQVGTDPIDQGVLRLLDWKINMHSAARSEKLVDQTELRSLIRSQGLKPCKQG